MGPARITALLYAPNLGPSDPRIPGAVHALEQALPGVRLDHEVTAAGTARQLPDREDSLRIAAARGDLPFIFDPDEARYVGVRSRTAPGPTMPAGLPAFELWASLPLSEPVDRLDDAAGTLGDAIGAWWGAASPDAAAAVIAQQTVFPHLARPTPAGLPALKPPSTLTDPYIPHRLGWINVWSQRTAELLGFPNPAEDGDWFARQVRTMWVVRLTPDPLDLGRDDHRTALRRAYERFPQVGRT